MKTSDLYRYAQLAEAAYAPFVYEGEFITLEQEVRNILQGLTPSGHFSLTNKMTFSAIQAEAFTAQWEVLAQQPNTASGFPATLCGWRAA